MNVHKNARLTPCGRERIVRQVESAQMVGTLSVRVNDQVLEIAYLFSALILGCVRVLFG